jgi:hypothetical protein
VGVQMMDGAWVPPGTNTGGTVVRIHETGPSAGPDGVFDSQCRTVPGSEQSGSTETSCEFDYVFGNNTFTVPEYTVGAGDTVTFTQKTAKRSLHIDSVPRRFGPCVNEADPSYPFCPDGDNVVTFVDQESLYGVMSSRGPIDYWVLTDHGAPAANDIDGQPLLSRIGSGPALTWNAPTNPAWGEPGSVRMTPNGRRSGEYLRSGFSPADDYSGTVVIWFRAPKALPAWRQVIAVDNGAWSGTGGGLMIDAAGHLISADAAGFVDYRSSRTVNDGHWHCAVWSDTYNHPSGDPAEWTGSTLYLDGRRLTGSLTALWSRLLSVPGSRLLLGDAGPDAVRAVGRFTGNLSNVALYDQVLGPDAVERIWKVGIGRPDQPSE